MQIWSYVATDSLDGANRLNASFHDQFQLLGQFPSVGRSRDDLGPDLRNLPVGNYLIFYRTSEAGIEIARVLSQGRDIDPTFF
jgi:toxin ParE1/3/4